MYQPSALKIGQPSNGDCGNIDESGVDVEMRNMLICIRFQVRHQLFVISRRLRYAYHKHRIVRLQLTDCRLSDVTKSGTVVTDKEYE